MDIRDFSERPANDMRPPKPPRKTKAYMMDIIPLPGCSDYMAMNQHSYGHPQATTTGDQKPTDREEEGPDQMANLFEEVPSQNHLQQ